MTEAPVEVQQQELLPPIDGGLKIDSEVGFTFRPTSGVAGAAGGILDGPADVFRVLNRRAEPLFRFTMVNSWEISSCSMVSDELVSLMLSFSLVNLCANASPTVTSTQRSSELEADFEAELAKYFSTRSNPKPKRTRTEFGTNLRFISPLHLFYQIFFLK